MPTPLKPMWMPTGVMCVIGLFITGTALMLYKEQRPKSLIVCSQTAIEDFEARGLEPLPKITIYGVIPRTVADDQALPPDSLHCYRAKNSAFPIT